MATGNKRNYSILVGVELDTSGVQQQLDALTKKAINISLNVEGKDDLKDVIDGLKNLDKTAKEAGEGTKKVSDGDKVHAGDILVEADLEEIKNAGYQTTTMMILTNTDEFGNVTKAEPAEVKTTSKVMTLTK